MPNNQMVEALPFNIIHSFIHSLLIENLLHTRYRTWHCGE